MTCASASEQLILGIETSCDETAAAIVTDGRRVLSSFIASQEQIHALFGGVVPEIASRQHTELLVNVTERALQQAGVMWCDLRGIAVTNGPGLIGSLLVGVSTAKAYHAATGLPLVGVIICRHTSPPTSLIYVNSHCIRQICQQCVWWSRAGTRICYCLSTPPSTNYWA